MMSVQMTQKIDILLSEQPSKEFNGWIEGIALADIIQLCCLAGRKQVLTVRHNDLEGFIWFDSGAVVHAQVGDVIGQKAFYEIMCWGSGSFVLKKASPPEATIDVPWNFLLIEALRIADERAKSNGLTMESRATKVLIVDDSPIVCKAIRNAISGVKDIEVVAEAYNGRQALEMLDIHQPDILCLDVNMPVMSGDIALMHIMVRSPCPVIIISGLGVKGSKKVLEFLRLGAIDFVPKPQDPNSWDIYQQRLIKDIKKSRSLCIDRIRRARLPKVPTTKLLPGLPATRLVIICGGIGGILEIQKLLPSILPLDSMSVVILQDMVPDLVDPLASFLDKYSAMTVSALKAGGPLLSGQCWLANWDRAWQVVADRHGAALSQNPGNFDPNKLLATAAAAFGPRLCIVLLSGIELEIEKGLKEVSKRSGKIIVQDPQTCLSPNSIDNILRQELEDEKADIESMSNLIAQWAV